MHIDKFSASLSVFANLGMLVGIAFLVVEIQQSNRIGIATAEVETRGRSTSLVTQTISNPEFAKVLAKLTVGENDLLPFESLQVRDYVTAYLNTWNAAEASFNNGLLTQRSFNIYLQNPKTQMERFPGTVSYYNLIRNEYQIEVGSSQVWDKVIQELQVRGY